VLEAKRSEKIRLELELKNVQRQIAMLRKSGNKIEVSMTLRIVRISCADENENILLDPKILDTFTYQLSIHSPAFAFSD